MQNSARFITTGKAFFHNVLLEDFFLRNFILGSFLSRKLKKCLWWRGLWLIRLRRQWRYELRRYSKLQDKVLWSGNQVFYRLFLGTTFECKLDLNESSSIFLVSNFWNCMNGKYKSVRYNIFVLEISEQSIFNQFYSVGVKIICPSPNLMFRSSIIYSSSVPISQNSMATALEKFSSSTHANSRRICFLQRNKIPNFHLNQKSIQAIQIQTRMYREDSFSMTGLRIPRPR